MLKANEATILKFSKTCQINEIITLSVSQLGLINAVNPIYE